MTEVALSLLSGQRPAVNGRVEANPRGLNISTPSLKF
jgi:hypothetical protein